MGNQGDVVELTAPDGTQFRLTMREKVERKTTVGEWEEILVAKDPSQAEQAYRDQTQTTNLSYLPGPLDELIDPVSGNLLLAMGGEGVMIIEPDGQQVWVAVGEYRHGGLREDGMHGNNFPAILPVPAGLPDGSGLVD